MLAAVGALVLYVLLLVDSNIFNYSGFDSGRAVRWSIVYAIVLSVLALILGAKAVRTGRKVESQSSEHAALAVLASLGRALGSIIVALALTEIAIFVLVLAVFIARSSAGLMPG